MDQRPPEGEQPRNGLPVISQETRDKILEEMGLSQKEVDQQPPGGGHPTDQLLREAIDVQTGKIQRERSDRYNRVGEVVLSSLMDIAEVKPEFVRALKSGVDTGIGYPDSVSADDYARGISLVLKAFHIESDYKLIPDLERLTGKDMEDVKQAIANGLQAYEKEHNAFNKALNFPRVPSTQGFLREVIERPRTDISPYTYGDRYRVGAGLMYRAMETIWSRLYPGQAPSSEPPSTPPAPDQPGPQFPPPSGSF